MSYKNLFEEPAPSNSRLSVHQTDTHPNHVLNISWDRMTVIGNLKEEETKRFRDFCAVNPLVKVNKTATDLVQATLYDGVFYLEYDKLKGKSHGRRNIRIEFNPNNCGDNERDFFRKHLLSCMSDVGFSRLDIATDVNFNLSGFTIIPKNPVKETVFYGRDGSVETIYMGSRESEKYIRVYNKRREREDKGFSSDHEIIWRLEFELKREAVDQWQDVYDDVLIKKADWQTLTDLKERAMIYMLLHEKGEWGNLNRKTRYKYRDILKKMQGYDATALLRDSFVNNRDRLQGELESWIGKKISDGGDI